MFLRAHLWIGLLLLLTTCAALGDDPVTIEAESCFANMAPRGGVYPVVVSLHNSGPSSDGALVVKSEAFSDVLRTYAYPVNLPTGTDKQIIVYPAVNPYTEKINLSFVGPARAKDVSLAVLPRDGMQVGMIGDEVGALSALRMARAQPSSGSYRRPPPRTPFNDCYAKPEAAPDRAAGYQSISMLVLSAGAERLRPEQWAAVRHWVLDGGSLVLVGGAGATYLRVPDAAPFLPVGNLQDTSLPALTLPRQITPQSLPGGTVALVSGALKPGGTVLASQGGQVVLARQALGAGTVLFVGFNPLEQPFRGWAGQHDLWLGLIRQATATVPAWNLRQWTSEQTSFMDERRYGGGYYGGSYYGGRRGASVSNRVNPFRIKLPPLTTIAWLFLAYFVLVIPVTYLVLKRIGRLEWAWVTSPALSIAFAYVFYLFTAQLYQAGMSRRTAGVVVAAAGNPEAQFDGFSEMFFPRGGSYPIGIPGAEALELSPFSSNDNSGRYYGSGSSGGTQLQPLETVDGGDVRAPDYQMGNLAFRRLYHTEPVLLGGSVTATLTRKAQGGLTGTIRNGTGLSLTGGGIYLPGTGIYARVGDLAPGQSATVGGSDMGGTIAGTIQMSPFANTAYRHEPSAAAGAFLVAHLSGARFGPPLGRDVGGSSSVTLIVSLPVTSGGQP